MLFVRKMTKSQKHDVDKLTERQKWVRPDVVKNILY